MDDFIRLFNEAKQFVSTHVLDSFSEENSSSDPVTELAVQRIEMDKSTKSEELDKNRLIKAKAGKEIEPHHRDFFLNLATLFVDITQVSSKTKKALELAALHGYSKAATIDEKNAAKLGIQTSPILPQEHRYHRNTPNTLLDAVQKAYAEEMGLKRRELMLIDSPLIKEVFAREMSSEGQNLDIGSEEEFQHLIDELLEKAASNQFPKSHVLVDITQLITTGTWDVNLMRESVKRLEEIVQEKIVQFSQENPHIPPRSLQEKLIGKLCPYGIVEQNEEFILILPTFLQNNLNSYGDMEDCIKRAGFRLSPDQLKLAWLKEKDTSAIFKELDLPLAELATNGKVIPEVCKSFTDFLKQPVVQKFSDLGIPEDAPPYLRVLPEATVNLLKGFEKFSIDKIFQDKKITSILQVAYFRILNAMQEAILRKEDPIQFYNQIELIHQEIQNILAISEPYDEASLAKSAKERLTTGENPVIPQGLPPPRVHAKPSSMHGLSSVLSSIEAQKGTNALQVVVLKDCYYESTGTLNRAKTYTTSELDGDAFRESGGDLTKAFDSLPKEPLDVYICEIHHNISPDRSSYTKENVLDQIKALYAMNLAAPQLTVVIDCTIDLEESDDIRTLLSDKAIQGLIDVGRLNISLLRSAQKFDMLGMDNYYGGISTSINNEIYFSSFDARMDLPYDQLRGLSYQGLAHLQAHSKGSLDKYRLLLMQNTHTLYDMMPREAIFQEGKEMPMQISKMQDERSVFLDIKFPRYNHTGSIAMGKLQAFVESKKLPFTSRASFGFATTNFSSVDGLTYRINPGLDDEKTLQLYAAFFNTVQKIITDCMDENKGLDKRELDELIAKRIETIDVTKIQ